MSAPHFLYRMLASGARALVPAAALFSPKLKAGLTGRRTDRARLADWNRTAREPGRPLLHLHAASAGELRQAEPVLRRLRTRHPDWLVAVTCFSPSGLAVANELGARSGRQFSPGIRVFLQLLRGRSVRAGATEHEHAAVRGFDENVDALIKDLRVFDQLNLLLREVLSGLKGSGD